MTAIPHLIAEVPGAPRVETRAYVSPKALPPAIAALLATSPGDLDRDQLLDLAADAASRDTWDLAGRSGHIAAVCKLACELAQELDISRKQLEVAHGIAQAEVQRLARLNADQYEQIVAARAEALQLREVASNLGGQLAASLHAGLSIAADLHCMAPLDDERAQLAARNHQLTLQLADAELRLADAAIARVNAEVEAARKVGGA